ncbi:MAG: hypothetical protein ACLTRS_09940 [Lachnospiraceae bacterium]
MKWTEASRIWLDQILKKSLERLVDWSLVDGRRVLELQQMQAGKSNQRRCGNQNAPKSWA